MDHAINLGTIWDKIQITRVKKLQTDDNI